MKPFNATIAYTCGIYQESDVLSKDYKPFGGLNAGVSKGKYIWVEFDNPEKFYAVIQKVAEYLRTCYGSLDKNSLLIELDGYIYNLTDYKVYRNFLYDFELRIY